MDTAILSDSCPTNCGITRGVLEDNPCLACECEWYGAIEEREEIDDWDQEEIDSPTEASEASQ